LPPFPEDCRGMRCGAKTPKGTPCKNLSIEGNGRCKFHGGLSTGPRTPDALIPSLEEGPSMGQRLVMNSFDYHSSSVSSQLLYIVANQIQP
jgi:hypothetical protein